MHIHIHIHALALYLTLNGVDSLGQAADILRGDAGNGDAAVLGGVDGVLRGELVHGGGVEPRVGEHADLRRDVRPVVLAAELLEVLLEQGPHRDDAVRHLLDLAQPLLVQRRVVQDRRRDPRPVDRRVRVQRAHQDLHLRVDPLLLLGRGRHDREGAYALAVETLFAKALLAISVLLLSLICSSEME